VSETYLHVEAINDAALRADNRVVTVRRKSNYNTKNMKIKFPTSQQQRELPAVRFVLPLVADDLNWWAPRTYCSLRQV